MTSFAGAEKSGHFGTPLRRRPTALGERSVNDCVPVSKVGFGHHSPDVQKSSATYPPSEEGVVPVLAAAGMRGRVRLTEAGLSVHVSLAGVRPIGPVLTG